MNPDGNINYHNPYSNYPSISRNVAAKSPAAIMRRISDSKSPYQRQNHTHPNILMMAIIEEKFERMLKS